MPEVTLHHKEPNVFYIDKITYSSLVKTEIPEQDIYTILSASRELINRDSLSNKVSVITTEYMICFNFFVKNFLFSLDMGYTVNDFSIGSYLSSDEKEFIRDKVKDYLLNEDNKDNESNYNENNKFYDIRAFTNNSLLVVVGKGFINLIASNKDNLLEIILNIIRYLDSSGRSSYFYNRLYLNLKLQNNYFTLLRSKLDL